MFKISRLNSENSLNFYKNAIRCLKIFKNIKNVQKYSKIFKNV